MDEELDRLLDEGRAADAVEARVRERWLRRQAEEDARFVGVLLDVAEWGRAVGITTVTGRLHHGRLTLVADDCVVLRDDGGRDVYVALDGIAAVVPDPGASTATASGERPPPSPASLLGLLADRSAERPTVQLVLRGVPDGLRGRLVAAGADVVTLLLDGEPTRTCFVPAQSVVSVSDFESG